MPNKSLSGYSKKEADSGTTTGYRAVYEFCDPADSATDETMNADTSTTPDDKVWYTQKSDILNADGDEAIASDCTFKDGATPLTPTVFDAATGKTTFSSAPAATPTATYKYQGDCKHEEVYVAAEDMTDPEDAAEADAKLIAAAKTQRDAWLAAKAAETKTSVDDASLSGNKTLA